jgi:hypothetical protein
MQPLHNHRYVASLFKSKACHCMGVEFIKVEENQTVYTADEGPVRIQYKYLVPIYVFPEMKVRGLQFPHSCICEQFIYSWDWCAYFAAAK